MRAQAQQRTNVERFEHRIHGEAIAWRDGLFKPERFSAADDQFDLGVRHAAELYQMTRRRGRRVGQGPIAEAPI